MTFRLFSSNVSDGDSLPIEHVYDGFGHSGRNRSPHLAWEGVPDETKSFVVTMYDPDAPTGSGFWHWIVADLPGSERELAEEAGSGEVPLPAGSRHMRNDFGTPGYVGAARRPVLPIGMYLLSKPCQLKSYLFRTTRAQLWLG